METVAALLGMANVVLLVRRTMWNFPFGLAMVALYALIFFEARLYSDALLQVFFFTVQLYGVWHWARHRGDDGLIEVTRMPLPTAALWLAGALVGTVLLGWLSARYSDASYPYWDTAVAMLSVVGQILLSRRVLENWAFWIAVDLIAMPLFWVKGLHQTAVLYFVFLVLACLGLAAWRRALREGRPA